MFAADPVTLLINSSNNSSHMEMSYREGKMRSEGKAKRKSISQGNDPKTFEENSQGRDPKTQERNSQQGSPGVPSLESQNRKKEEVRVLREGSTRRKRTG